MSLVFIIFWTIHCGNTRFHIVWLLFSSLKAIVQTHRNLREDYGPRKRPFVLAIRQIVEKIEATFTLNDSGTS